MSISNGVNPSISSLLSLNGKTALVTGAAAGIGFGIALRLAEAGARVAVVDRDADKAKAAAERLTQAGYDAAAFSCDVADEAQVTSCVAAVALQFGSLDILVNNAGIFPNIPFLSMTSADFDKVVAVNLRGVYLCSSAAAKQMIAQGKGGKIINITSIDALHPSMVGLAHYDATKHGVWGFTKNVALELAPHKIAVNAIAPGGVRTPGVVGEHEAEALKAMEGFIKGIPMQRLGEPDDIGRVALFLASDLSSYMTGSQIVVDGGYLLS